MDFMENKNICEKLENLKFTHFKEGLHNLLIFDVSVGSFYPYKCGIRQFSRYISSILYQLTPTVISYVFMEKSRDKLSDDDFPPIRNNDFCTRYRVRCAFEKF